MRDGQEIADEFRGVTFLWLSVTEESHGEGQQNSHRRRQCQRLTFHKRHRRLVIDEYLAHVRRRGREILFSNRRRCLYTNNRIAQYSCYNDDNAWSFINFNHPTTFETLAMEPAKKKKIMDDLDAFRKNRDFYRRTGKLWKRGYLLYCPPGTGKSTMIAAMANHLNYDIYDVELTVVHNNNDLRKLLIQTTSKSILRIDVFTTNHADKLDPALIRRGRMDMHIEMSYCGFEAFKTLAKNYLDIEAHPLFGAVEELLREVDITPADVAESLMTAKNEGSGEDASLEYLIEELKKMEEAKASAEASAAKTDNGHELEEGQSEDFGEGDEESEYSEEYDE
ncbi:AAA-ATPase [Dichanthelium oligosanthes]|uniref:AAA-ATPase n=1 Tax=Dichanthelium oligosanthes TaxID=888268 RepID=A0A1E5VFR5_9POAL|nr:AAA-ATPase [Dichanthelium oligosanthes]